MSNGRDSATVTPFPLAMVVCDFIYRDPFNGKYTLIGTFSTIAARGFPSFHPHLFVYAALTGGRGVIPLRLELTAPDGTILMQVGGEVDSKDDPRVIQEVGIALSALTFPVPGEYRLSLFANDEFMVERRLLLLSHQPPQEDDDDN